MLWCAPVLQAIVVFTWATEVCSSISCALQPNREILLYLSARLRGVLEIGWEGEVLQMGSRKQNLGCGTACLASRSLTCSSDWCASFFFVLCKVKRLWTLQMRCWQLCTYKYWLWSFTDSYSFRACSQSMLLDTSAFVSLSSTTTLC